MLIPRQFITLALCYTVLSPAASAGVITVNPMAPTDAVVFHTTGTADAVVFRASDGGATLDNRVIAQSFTMPETSWVSAIAVRSDTSSASADNIYPALGGTHVMQLAVMQDTNNNNIGDTQVGGISTFDVAGMTLTDTHYVTFTLDAPILLLSGEKYSFELGFTTADAENSFGFSRDGTDTYAGGSFAAYNDVAGSPFPAGDTHLATAGRDVTFYIIPEPSSLVMLGFGGLLIARRRRR